MNKDWNGFVKFISDYTGVPVEEITEQTDMYEDLFLDSLGMFSFGAQVSEKFEVKVPLSKVATVSKAGEIYQLIAEAMQEGK